jgi:Helix-turn-helix domain
MSWQATAWAEKQKTGSPARKVLLLVLANYANDQGYCWPSQATIAAGTEQSLDTVQRNLKKLEADGLIIIERRRRASGQWPALSYRLVMPIDDLTVPQNAVRQRSNTVDKSGDLRHGHAAPAAVTEPQALRHEPSREQLIEPSTLNRRSRSLSTPQKAKRSSDEERERIEIVQNRIARRLGKGDAQEGWMMLGALNDLDRYYLTQCERAGGLTDEMLIAYRNHVRDHPILAGTALGKLTRMGGQKV